MAKMTDEEKKQKIAAKKAERKAKKAARKAAMLLKKQERAAKKKAKREAKKARELEKREKQKAKKLAMKEKKRLAREKKRALEAAKKLKMKQKKNTSNDGAIDVREAAKNIKRALNQLAVEFAVLDPDKRAKHAKSIVGLGYDVSYNDGLVTVKFTAEKSRKDKNSQPKENPITPAEPEKKAVAVVEPDVVEPVEVPAGDLYGQDGNSIGEVANIEDDDVDSGDENDEYNGSDDTIIDSRDETDEDLIENRREFFGNFGEDFEPNDD